MFSLRAGDLLARWYLHVLFAESLASIWVQKFVSQYSKTMKQQAATSLIMNFKSINDLKHITWMKYCVFQLYIIGNDNNENVAYDMDSSVKNKSM